MTLALFCMRYFRTILNVALTLRTWELKWGPISKSIRLQDLGLVFTSRNDELEGDSAHLGTDFWNWKGQLCINPCSPCWVQTRKQAPARLKFTQQLNSEVRAPDSQATGVSSSSNQMLESEEQEGQEGLGSSSVISRETLFPNYISHWCPLWQICILPKPPRYLSLINPIITIKSPQAY